MNGSIGLAFLVLSISLLISSKTHVQISIKFYLRNNKTFCLSKTLKIVQ